MIEFVFESFVYLQQLEQTLDNSVSWQFPLSQVFDFVVKRLHHNQSHHMSESFYFRRVSAKYYANFKIKIHQ